MSRIRKHVFGALVAVVTLFAGVSSAKADLISINVDISGIQVRGGLTDPNTPIVTINLADYGFSSPATLLSFDYDFTYQAFPISWLSELWISFDSSPLPFGDDWFDFNPGGPNTSGILAYSGSEVADVTLNNDGLLFIRFWDDFNDLVDPDGVFHQGSSLTLNFDAEPLRAVPVPGGVVLAGMGVLSFGGFSLLRRRKLQAA